MTTYLHQISCLFVAQDKHAEAEPLLRRSLEIREATLGLEHPVTATTLNNLAVSLEGQVRTSVVTRSVENSEGSCGRSRRKCFQVSSEELAALECCYWSKNLEISMATPILIPIP